MSGKFETTIGWPEMRTVISDELARQQQDRSDPDICFMGCLVRGGLATVDGQFDMFALTEAILKHVNVTLHE
jgi:hypothetical protein